MVPLVAGALAFALLAAPMWTDRLRRQSTLDDGAPSRAATTWVLEHVPKDGVVIVDNYNWLDLTLHGYTKPVWFWKLDTDPAVMHDILPSGYASVDYIVMPNVAQDLLDSRPTLRQALNHSHEVASFGALRIRRVDPPGN
jgi:hypothetical protein